MTFKELQKLVSKRYSLDAATAAETTKMLFDDKFWNFKKMNKKQASEALKNIENYG